ncbi:hypothetical protein BDV12DRAFT_176962 [Aspergillus spectabilis]
MGGVDIASQLHSNYNAQRVTYCCWWPLFFWVSSVAVASPPNYIHVSNRGMVKNQCHN